VPKALGYTVHPDTVAKVMTDASLSNILLTVDKKELFMEAYFKVTMDVYSLALPLFLVMLALQGKKSLNMIHYNNTQSLMDLFSK
jgi:general stress protein CsbA